VGCQRFLFLKQREVTYSPVFRGCVQNLAAYPEWGCHFAVLKMLLAVWFRPWGFFELDQTFKIMFALDSVSNDLI
jgi:hypothetical protein